MKKSILFTTVIFSFFFLAIDSHMAAYNGMNLAWPGQEMNSTCDAPDMLTTINITQTTATWDWNPVSGAMSYSLQWRHPGGSWYNLIGGPWTITALNIAGFQPGTDYEWRVRSNCPYGMTSTWSDSASFTTLISSCSMPTGLSTTNITEASATFNWSAVPGAQSYSVQIQYPYGAWSYIPGSPFMGTTATVNSLAPGTTYHWRVRSNCGYGDHSYWTPGMSFTTIGSSSCNVPDTLTTISITQTTATWDWSPVIGAVSYSVQWRFAGGTWYNLSGGPWTNTILHIAGLQPGTTYEWRVRSNCPNGMHSEYSNGAIFTTLSSACSTPPSGLSTTNITDTSAMFNWSVVPGAVSYSVQIRLPYGTWNFIPGSPFMNTSATVNGLSPGTTYQWRIRANCSYGDHSYWTLGMSFTTNGTSTCNAPDTLTTYNISQTTATWDWAPVSGAVSYSVQWRFAGGIWYNLAGGPWTNTLLNIAGLQPNTDYEWRVRSNCSNGMTSDWSANASFTTLGFSCDMPTGLFTTNITESSATFNWSASPGAVSYSVQTRVPYGTWYYIAGSPFINTYASVDGLNPNTTYEWRVRSNCSNGDHSYWTSGMSFTTGGTNSGNDNCADAMYLTVNSTCMNTPASSIGATPSMPPPVGGCFSGGYKDVWFRFNMPNVNYPVVTIRTSAGTLTDGVMEVYVGNSCSGMSFLTCEDDNNNGNGSKMPVISLSGGPNVTIFVRVWGYGGSTGTFSICILNYQSANYAGDDHTFIIPDEGKPIATLDKSVDTPVDGEISSTLTVAPNPANDILNVTYSETTFDIVSGLALIDVSGKVILKKEYETGDAHEFNEQLDIAELSSGIYILQLKTTSGIITRKISVVHD